MRTADLIRNAILFFGVTDLVGALSELLTVQVRPSLATHRHDLFRRLAKEVGTVPLNRKISYNQRHYCHGLTIRTPQGGFSFGKFIVSLASLTK